MPTPAEPVVQRPRDAEATRRAIVEQARVQFTRAGYRATTVKGVADAAGVSPNLITRYFGGKERLFLVASNPQIAVDDVYTGPVTGLGDRLGASITRRWFGQPGEDPLLMLLRAAGERAEAAEALAAFLDEYSVGPLRRYLEESGLSPAAAAARADAIDTFLLGVSARRRVLRSALGPPDQLQRWLAETIQRLATGR